MATRPTTAPTHAPSADGLLPRIASKKIQASAAAAEAVLVVANAIAAWPDADNADPALNPNQPNHSKPVPSITNGMFPGVCASPASCILRRPRLVAPASAPTPAGQRTPVPPATAAT